ETQDLIPLNGRSIEAQLAELLHPGDTFVDCVPFFPGLTGVQIARAIDSHCKEKTDFRCLNEDDEVCVWDRKTEKPVGTHIDLNRVRNIIDHKGKQGTDWDFASGTSGLVGMDAESEFTSFCQSLLRLRLLGKGQKGKIVYHLLAL